jgi:hypothetical protein
LGKVKIEEEDHLDVIATDGGVPPVPYIQPEFSPSLKEHFPPN